MGNIAIFDYRVYRFQIVLMPHLVAPWLRPASVLRKLAEEAERRRKQAEEERKRKEEEERKKRLTDPNLGGFLHWDPPNLLMFIGYIIVNHSFWGSNGTPKLE